MREKFLGQNSILISTFLILAGCVALMDSPLEDCEDDIDCDFGELCFEYNKSRRLCYAANLCDENICECSPSSYDSHCPTGYFCYRQADWNSSCKKSDWCLQNACDCYLDSDCPEGFYCLDGYDNYGSPNYNTCMPGTGS